MGMTTSEGRAVLRSKRAPICGDALPWATRQLDGVASSLPFAIPVEHSSQNHLYGGMEALRVRFRYRLLVIGFALCFGPAALAQTRILTGRVTDSVSTEPVTAGQVAITGTTIANWPLARAECVPRNPEPAGCVTPATF
jgi:hypothetical protein